MDFQRNGVSSLCIRSSVIRRNRITWHYG